HVLVYQQLLGLGIGTCAAARQNRGCPSPQIRAQCCRILDHLMDPGSIPALAGAPLFLQRSQASARVRAMAAKRFGAWAHSRPAPPLPWTRLPPVTPDAMTSGAQEDVVVCARRRDLPPSHAIKEPITPVSIQSARPVTSSTTEAILGRVWLG